MDNEINNIQNDNETVNRPSKSGVAGSSPAGPTKESTGCGSCATRLPAESDSRGSLNAGKTLAGIAIDDKRWVQAFEVLERLHESGYALAFAGERGPGGISTEAACSELQVIFSGGAR